GVSRPVIGEAEKKERKISEQGKEKDYYGGVHESKKAQVPSITGVYSSGEDFHGAKKTNSSGAGKYSSGGAMPQEKKTYYGGTGSNPGKTTVKKSKYGW
ncbi:MAG: hypothetical protein MJ252_20070, partial [archaeon]|nr:hypothetical protein [archaeon]